MKTEVKRGEKKGEICRMKKEQGEDKSGGKTPGESTVRAQFEPRNVGIGGQNAKEELGGDVT